MLRRALIGSALLVFGVAAILAVLPGYKPARHPFFVGLKSNQVEIFAHGAGQGVAPTNTLLALETAFASGADALEIDVQLTRDNELVLHHDDTLDRTTDLSGPVADMTWAQIEAADKGSAVTIAGQRFADADTKVVRLDTALIALPAARWNIEIKNDSAIAASEACKAISNAGLVNAVLVASFHNKAMKEFRRLCPRVATSMAQEEVRLFLLASKVGLSRFVKTSAVAVQVPVEGGGFDLTNPRFVAALKARNIKLHYWTINEPTQMRLLINAGADGLLTDFVVRAQGVAEAQSR